MACPAGIGEAASVADVVRPGDSIIKNAACVPLCKCVCTINIENWTKYPLVDSESHINRGKLKSPPVEVQPGKRESFVGYKTGQTLTGTSGTASWLIAGQDRRIVVMWSIPYSFDLFKNWLGVGLIKSGSKTKGKHLFDKMYYEYDGDGLTFVRGKYHHHLGTLSTTEGNIVVTGTMGSSQNTTAHIIVKPILANDLAPSIKAKVDLALFK